MDEADHADRHIEMTMAQQLARRRPQGGLLPSGACHYCAEPVGRPQLFCNGECADDWQAEQDARVRNHGVR